MEIKKAIEILEYHQEWRLGKREDMIYEPKKLTQALDIVLSEVKLPIHNVSNRYTIEDIEKCVENWGICKVEKEYIERFLNGC